LDDDREEKPLNGFGSWDQAVLLFRTASLAPRGAIQTRAEALHDLAIVRTRWDFHPFSFPHSDKQGLGSQYKPLIVSG
jgi:hypothetical protein